APVPTGTRSPSCASPTPRPVGACQPLCVRGVAGGSEVGFDSFGVDECELTEGGLPVRGHRALDESAGGSPLAGGQATFFGSFAGSLVLDVADSQPQQLDHGSVVGEVAAVLGDLA